MSPKKKKVEFELDSQAQAQAQASTQASTQAPGELKSDCVVQVENFREKVMSKKITEADKAEAEKKEAAAKEAAAQADPNTDLKEGSSSSLKKDSDLYTNIGNGISSFANRFNINLPNNAFFNAATTSLPLNVPKRKTAQTSQSQSIGGRKKRKSNKRNSKKSKRKKSKRKKTKRRTNKKNRTYKPM